MSQIDLIRAEIERLKEKYTNMMPSIQKCSVCDDLLSFLDTIKEQPVCDGLDFDAEISALSYHFYSAYGKVPMVKDFARHFYELGCRRTAEKYDEIEYKRQRADVCEGWENSALLYGQSVKSEYPLMVDTEGCEHPMFDTTDIEDAFKAGANWQKEQMMIQWTGNNLKDVIEFTGKSPRFNEWFKSWDDYEDYVRQHGNIFKMFNDDGSHLEVPVGAWIVKTPDKRCVASKFTLKQPESEKIAAAYQLGLADKEKKMMKEAVEGEVARILGSVIIDMGDVEDDKILNDYKPGDKVKLIIIKED